METFYTYLANIWDTGLSTLPFIVTTLLFMLGMLSTVLPILPGNIIVWLAIVIHKLWVGDASVSWWFVGITGFIALLAQAADWACSYWGAKRFGASRHGAIGALLGTFVAFFVPPPLFWIFFGPFIGAIIGELFAKRPFEDARKAGFGSFLGGLAAMAVKMFLAALSISWFYVELYFTS